MRDILIMIGSMALSTGVVMNAFHQKKQFYPSIVYITKSSPSMAILYLQAFIMVVLLGKMMRKIFFGTLRTAEVEHLIERSWYAVTETCLAFTVFRDDFSPRFVALFTFLLFIKGFHWLAEDRIDYMERSPLISVLFHLRAIGLLFVLGLTDFYFISHAYENLLINGPTVQLVFGFEYAILLTIVVLIFTKYILHSVDITRVNPWENKAVYLLYTELVLGFTKVILYLMFLGIMLKVHTFPLFVVRPMYLTIREFKKTFNDVIMSRRAIHNMNTRYEDASEEELARMDNICIICREEMRSNAKKLPCNHIFHSACLRSWFQRQQTCPTCRTDVFRTNVNPRANQDANNRVPPPEAPAANNVQNNGPEVQQMFVGGYNLNMPFPQNPQGATAAPSQNQSSTSGQNFTTMPPFPPFPPFIMPPPLIPPTYSATDLYQMPKFSDLNRLTDEELRQLEGFERQNIEARVRCLRDVSTLLDAAVMQMQQYIDVINRLPINPEHVKNSQNIVQEHLSATNSVKMFISDSKESLCEEIVMNESEESSVDQLSTEVRKRRIQIFDNVQKDL